MVKAQSGEVQLTVPRHGKLPPPEGANFVNFSFSGPEVEMMVGYVDLHRLALSAPNTGRIEAEITHRFFMSLRGFIMMKSQIDTIWKSMQEKGVIQDPDEKPHV